MTWTSKSPIAVCYVNDAKIGLYLAPTPMLDLATSFQVNFTHSGMLCNTLHQRGGGGMCPCWIQEPSF